MDPKATYIDMCDAIGRNDRAAARLHAANLRAWLARGGFIPPGYNPDEFREHVASVLRSRAGEIERCPRCECMPGDGPAPGCPECRETLDRLAPPDHGWKPTNSPDYRCGECRSNNIVYRVVECGDGAYDDYQYRFRSCDHKWWVESSDA